MGDARNHSFSDIFPLVRRKRKEARVPRINDYYPYTFLISRVSARNPFISFSVRAFSLCSVLFFFVFSSFFARTEESCIAYSRHTRDARDA